MTNADDTARAPLGAEAWAARWKAAAKSIREERASLLKVATQEAKDRIEAEDKLAAAEATIARLEAENAALRVATQEVVRISDRRHEAWDRAKTILSTEPGARGAAILAAAEDMATQIEGIVTNPGTTWKPGAKALARYRAALAGAGEGAVDAGG